MLHQIMSVCDGLGVVMYITERLCVYNGVKKIKRGYKYAYE
jgi:hypothetical protein